MTIMLAGGLTFAVPGAMPEAMAANANLYVSAENSQYDNTMTLEESLNEKRQELMTKIEIGAELQGVVKKYNRFWCFC
jgi:hypothetical protein